MIFKLFKLLKKNLSVINEQLRKITNLKLLFYFIKFFYVTSC